MSSPSSPVTPPATFVMASAVEVTKARVLTQSPEHQIEAKSAISTQAGNKNYCSTKGWSSVAEMFQKWKSPEEESLSPDTADQSFEAQSSEDPAAAVHESQGAATQISTTTALQQLIEFGEETLPSQSNQFEAEAVAEHAEADKEGNVSGEESDGAQAKGSHKSQSASEAESSNGEGDVSGEESDRVQAKRSEKSQSASEAESSDEEITQIASKSRDKANNNESPETVAAEPKDAAVNTREAAQEDLSTTATNSNPKPDSPVPMELETDEADPSKRLSAKPSSQNVIDLTDKDLPDSAEFGDSDISTLSLPSNSSASQPVSGRVSPWLQNWREKHGYLPTGSSSSSSSSSLSIPSGSHPSNPAASQQPLFEVSETAIFGGPDLHLVPLKPTDPVEREASGTAALATSSSSSVSKEPNQKRDYASSLRGACASLDLRKYWSKKEKDKAVSKEEKATFSKLDSTLSVTQRNHWPSLSLPQALKRNPGVSSSSVTASSATESVKETATKERKKIACHRNDVIMMTMALVVMGVVANHFIKR